MSKHLIMFSLIFVIMIITSVEAISPFVENSISEAEDFLYSTNNFKMNRPFIYEWLDWFLGTQYLYFANTILLSGNDNNIKSIIQHEYGHAVLDKLYNNYPICSKDLRKAHFYNLPMSCESSAFNEGWATAFTLAVRNNDSVTGGESNVYFRIPFENRTLFENTIKYYYNKNYIPSSFVEGTTSMILWDIIDNASSTDNSPNIDDDYINDRFDLIFDTLNQTQPQTILEFYDKWLLLSNEHKELKNELYPIYRQNGLKKSTELPQYYFDFNPLTGIRFIARQSGPHNNWPTFHHDLRRTGYTTLQGDLNYPYAHDVGVTLNLDIPAGSYDKVVGDDIDNNGGNGHVQF